MYLYRKFRTNPTIFPDFIAKIHIGENLKITAINENQTKFQSVTKQWDKKRGQIKQQSLHAE